MALTFNSKRIDKVIGFHDIKTLTFSEKMLLRDELSRAILTMEASLREVRLRVSKGEEKEDQHWINKVIRKQEVCGAFLAEVNKLTVKRIDDEKIEKPDDDFDSYDCLFNDILWDLITQELGPEKMESLIDKAEELSIRHSQKN